MLRGSRPGERRGGRKRDTPNRRTILRDRILSIGSDHPAASQRAFLVKLVKDLKLPADTRMAVAPRCFPPKRTRSSRAGRPRALGGSRTTLAQRALGSEGSASKGSPTPALVPAIRDWTPQALDTLFGVVQDATANPKARRKAALKIAEFLLPKAGKKAKVVPDEYGFLISPNLASDYWDIRLKLRVFMREPEPMRKIPAIAAKIQKLEARLDAIRRRVELPCPTKYGVKEAANDVVRLMEFGSRRGHETALTEAQQAAEAHLRLRLDVFNASPEAIARRRRAALEETERRFKMSRLNGGFSAPPLSRQERHELNLLRRFYPAEPNQSLSPLEDDEFETRHDHPFAHELPAPDGNFYPRHSKLPPADPQGYTVDDLAKDRQRLDQLRKARLERKKLTPEEDAEEVQLAARIAAYELNPEPLDEARIRELEERRAVGFQLTASEDGELRDLRERYPEFAAVMDLTDLHYLYHRSRELEIARKAGLDFDAMCKQADVICLRLRDESKYIHEWQAQTYVRDRSRKAAGAKMRDDGHAQPQAP